MSSSKSTHSSRRDSDGDVVMILIVAGIGVVFAFFMWLAHHDSDVHDRKVEQHQTELLARLHYPTDQLVFGKFGGVSVKLGHCDVPLDINEDSMLYIVLNDGDDSPYKNPTYEHLIQRPADFGYDGCLSGNPSG